MNKMPYVAVQGFAVFDSWDEDWQPEEYQPIEDILTKINEAARRYFKVIESEPRGTNVSWCFVKFGPDSRFKQYAYRKQFWTSSLYTDSIEEIVEFLWQEYRWCLEAREIDG